MLGCHVWEQVTGDFNTVPETTPCPMSGTPWIPQECILNEGRKATTRGRHFPMGVPWNRSPWRCLGENKSIEEGERVTEPHKLKKMSLYC